MSSIPPNFYIAFPIPPSFRLSMLLHRKAAALSLPFTVQQASSVFFLFFFQVQSYNRKYRSIGHRVWSMSLNFLTDL